MHGREFQRIPYVVQVEFRTASSFLVAYTVNLSRGGLFIETEHPVQIGSELPLQLAVPGHGPIALTGRVAWHRPVADEDGPAGMGVEFLDPGEDLGQVIDRLITQFKGLNVLLLAARTQEQSAITRLVRSVLSTANVIASNDFAKGRSMLDGGIDIAIVELDIYTDLALDLIHAARTHPSPIPVLALANQDELRRQARAAGADEVTRKLPPFDEFQRLLVRALGRPLRIRGEPR